MKPFCPLGWNGFFILLNHNMGKLFLEICTASVPSAIAARDGGADRVELCTALPEGGLTPSYATIKETRRQLSIPVHVLIRPREGDFLYSKEELDVMCEDISLARDLGVDGVVCGALDADGNIDRKAMERLMQASRGMSFTFHRAFDLCRNPFKSLDVLIELGVNTLLTSGQATTAPEGADLIKKLIGLSQETGLTIMPGCGIRPDNLAQFIRETGAQTVHLSARKLIISSMRFIQKNVAMGDGNTASEYDYWQTDKQLVMACREALSDKI